METYHRKRSKRSAINNEIVSFKRQEISSSVARQPPPLARHLLIDTNSYNMVDDEEVQVGSVYEIYHKQLPPRTPAQLMCTRVVMVSDKTDLYVGIRYPSSLSLRSYFSNGVTEMYPALDEKFVMGTKFAKKVLLRQVPTQEFAEKKHLVCFWKVNPTSQYRASVEDTGLARELKKNTISWGVRRQVMFIQRGNELSNTQSSSSFVHSEEKSENQNQNQIVVCKKDAETEDEEAKEEIKPASLQREIINSTRILRKRKKGKQVSHLKKVNKKPMKKCRALVTTKDPSDRWSKERYMAAELSLFEAMKEKKAMIGNPITRNELRVEARKRIGDTGLLDHLLKHVANKVAPDGELRFRRTHNADGAMEYWLEDAELLRIRKDAGVSDPFWTPPPGWKLGDSPMQDPAVAREINQLKEQISNLKRDHDQSKKELEEKIVKLKRDIDVKQDTSEDVDVVSDHVDSDLKQVMSILKFMLHFESETINNDAANSIFQREKGNKDIFDILKKIQAWMRADGKETTQIDAGSTKSAGTELITATVSDDQKESQQPKLADKNVIPAGVSEESGRTLITTAPPSEGKAAKIERLKSGFRIYRPQSTFNWPNMVNSTSTTHTTTPSSASTIVVPTPPSVNSSAPPQPLYLHHHLSLASPVKPVPKRPPTTIINLNHIPTNPSSQLTISTPSYNEAVEAYGAAGYKKVKRSSSWVSTGAWLADSGPIAQ